MDWQTAFNVAVSGVMLLAGSDVYRQALRDVPQQSGFPGDIDWPAKPE